MLKIIGGKFRGMKLEEPNSPLTRPTKAILKESLFNVLQNEIRDYVFIEGFGGSGSVGIEALSRGAKKAFFIEYNPQSFHILQKNLARLTDCEYESILGDSFEHLPKLLQNIEQKSILYLDPPFCIRDNMQEIYLRCFDLVAKIKDCKLDWVIFEHLSTYEMPKTLGNFCIIKQRKFGKSSLSYYYKEI